MFTLGMFSFKVNKQQLRPIYFNQPWPNVMALLTVNKNPCFVILRLRQAHFKD